jgi:hypothetical protein
MHADPQRRWAFSGRGVDDRGSVLLFAAALTKTTQTDEQHVTMVPATLISLLETTCLPVPSVDFPPGPYSAPRCAALNSEA